MVNPKVTIIQVVYNNRKWIPAVFDAIYNQTFKDFKVVAVISGNDDKSKELIMEKYPQTEIIDPGYNIGFAKGHNLVFEKYCNPSLNPSPYEGRGGGEVEFFQLVNPDMIMEPNYVEEMLKAFKNEKVGAATGKLYKISNFKFQISNFEKSRILDTTGVSISKSGRARDRGQHEIDNHQYDNLTEVDGVSGAGCMYRAAALQNIKYQISNIKFEFFDEDFHSYWEDVDLSWRLKNAGWKNVFVPSAVGYHGRTAGSSKGGYFKIISFIKHHQQLPERIRQLNYKNHIFMYIKNSPWFYPQFFIREFFMLVYIVLFEISTLKVLPEMFRLFSKMWKKRKRNKSTSLRASDGLIKDHRAS
jgi:GT2 family glycosyltransferase